jgi:hypothetical protein
MINEHNCPVCGQEYQSQCKCMVNHRTCPNGHEWHVCLVHSRVVIGPSDHFIGTDACQCNDKQESE